jgi:Ca2+-binding RTX toxin-like protein
VAFVVFAGQSNIGGAYMSAATLPQAWTPNPAVQIWNDASRAWETMQPGVNTGYAGVPGGWGPEVQFAADFQARFPGEPLRIVKIAHGGTGLRVDPVQWNYDWSPASDDELLDRATATIRAAAQAGGLGRPEMVFWGQGEEDANTGDAAFAYRQNLADFFGAIRQEWLGDPAGKIGFFQIGASAAYAGPVREAQQAVDLADVNAVSFDTLNFPRLGDGVHLAAGGHQMSGAEFLRIYAAWRGGQEPTRPTEGLQLTGTAGADTLLGGTAADGLQGLWGDDYLRGYEGADVLNGGDGFDILHGNQGNDTLSGGLGGDWVVGGQDGDLLFGDEGEDIVHGNMGLDTVEGGAGRDTLYGGQGEDVLRGGDGDDWLSGDRGSDTLSGGAGADTFYVFADSGLERIVDFDGAAGDRVRVAPGLGWGVAYGPEGAVVSVAGGAQVVLVGVSAAAVAGDWILSA